MNMPQPKDKPFAIPKSMVWEAYRRVAANKGAPGVDGQALDEFEADLRDNLYRIWNRMSSGPYFPPPVRAVEIPKPHGGGVRVLGVPTISDRIAQTVAAMFLEPLGSRMFHRDSYGYRPNKSALEAVGRVGGGAGSSTGSSIWMSRSSSTPFLGISCQSGRGGHRLSLGAAVCEAVARCPATAPRRHRLLSGTKELRRVRRFRRSWRICSCTSRSMLDGPELPGLPVRALRRRCRRALREQAAGEKVLAGIAARMNEVGLRLHPDKTRIVYCKDSNRRS